MDKDRQKKIAYLISKELSRPEKRKLTLREKFRKGFAILSGIMFLVSSIANYKQLLGINQIKEKDNVSILSENNNEITYQPLNSKNVAAVDIFPDNKNRLENKSDKKEEKSDSEVQKIIADSSIQSKNQDAINYYKQVINENPNETKTLISLVNLLMETKQYDDSLIYIEKLISINPANVSVYKVKGSVLYLQKRYDEAIGVFSKVIEMDPQDNNSYKLMGDIALKQAKYENAISYYQKALAINEKDVAVYQNIGVAAARIDRLDEALKYYEKGLRLDPNNEQILKNKQEILKNVK